MAKKPPVPIATRRLTKSEAKLLGVSYTAKRQVPVSIKRITKKTKIYTQRRVRQVKYGMSIEKRTLIKKIEHRAFGIEPAAHWLGLLPEKDNKTLRQMANAESVDDWYKITNQWLRDKLEKTELRNKIPDRDFRHLTYRRIQELQKKKMHGKPLSAWQYELLNWLDDLPEINPFFYH